MTFGSLFSGAGGFDIGLERAGLSCAWQCEIDPQASSVLAKHWPHLKQMRDVRAVKKKDLPAVDAVVGGFPCQGLSIAGNREGLRDERSGLYYELLRVVRLCRPRFVVWENVPGLLSCDDGRDFGRVLRGLADIGYFGAWRVLDARFFGVPQRRRRVFGVFARGRTGAVRCGQILALTEGVRRHPSPRGEAGEDVAGTLTGGARKRGGYSARDESGLVAARCKASRGHRMDGETDTLIPFSNRGNTVAEAETLRACSHGALPMVFCPDEAFTLKTQDQRVGNGWNGNIVVENTKPLHYTHDFNQDRIYGADGITPALTASDSNRTRNHLIAEAVRRLTPRECERLMSWPDDWTRYGHDGTEFADGSRYRMCGNGVVANVAEWIGRRLMQLGEGNA